MTTYHVRYRDGGVSLTLPDRLEALLAIASGEQPGSHQARAVIANGMKQLAESALGPLDEIGMHNHLMDGLLLTVVERQLGQAYDQWVYESTASCDRMPASALGVAGVAGRDFASDEGVGGSRA